MSVGGCGLVSGHVSARGGVLNVIVGVVLSTVVLVALAFCVVQLRRRRLRRRKLALQSTVAVDFLTRSPTSSTRHQQADTDTDTAARPLRPPYTHQTETVSIL